MVRAQLTRDNSIKDKTRGDRRSRIPELILLLTILLGFVLRIYRLGGQSFWEEEIFSIEFYARKTIHEIIEFNVYASDPQPPLYFVILRLWSEFSGLKEFAIRFLSLWFSVLSIPVIYKFGSALFPRRIGILAAILMAINPFQVWYAQEARTYSLTLLLTLMSTLLLFKAITAERRLGLLVAYAIVTNLAIYSHYYSYLVVFAQSFGVLGVWFIKRNRQNEMPDNLQPPVRSIMPLWIAQAAVFVPYIPWAPQAFRIIQGFTGWYVPISSTDLVLNTFRALTIGYSLEGAIVAPILAFFAALLMIGLLIGAIKSSKPRMEQGLLRYNWSILVLAAYLVLPLVVVVLFINITGRTVYNERYFIIIAPPLFIGVSVGIEACVAALCRLLTNRRPLLDPLLLLLALIPMAFASAYSLYNLYTDVQYQKSDIRSLVSYVKSIQQPGDFILTSDAGRELVVDHYDQDAIPADYLKPDISEDRRDFQAQLSEIIKAYKRIWFVPLTDYGNDQFIERWFNQHAYQVSHIWFGKARLIEFVAISTGDQKLTESRHITFDASYETVEFSLPKQPVVAGGVVPVDVLWNISGQRNQNVRVILDLIDKVGNHHSRVEDTLGARRASQGNDTEASFTEKYGLGVPIGTPPGEYNVEMFLVGPSGNLKITKAQGDSGGFKVMLGKVVVARGALIDNPSLPMTNRTKIDFGDSLTLLGHNVPRVPLNPGSPVSFSLFWKAQKDIGAQLTPVLEVRGKEAGVVGEAKGTLASELYPTNNWVKGEIVRDIRQVNLSPTTPSGTYDLVLYVVDHNGAKLGEEVVIDSVRVDSRSRNYTLPEMRNELRINFDDFAELEGYDISLDANGNPPSVVLTLYWKAVSPADVNYKVFVHALDRAGRILGQDDSPPDSGNAPTTSWIAHEIVTDRHTIRLPQNESVASLRVGLYEEISSKRVVIKPTDKIVQDNSLILPVANNP